MFVHSVDKLAKMRTTFHVIQAKLIMSVWCFTLLHCALRPTSNGAVGAAVLHALALHAQRVLVHRDQPLVGQDPAASVEIAQLVQVTDDVE